MYRPELLQNWPDRFEDRWDLIKEFVSFWYEETRPSDGYSKEQLNELEKTFHGSCPAAVMAWALHSGNRWDIWQHLSEQAIPLSQCRVEQATAWFPCNDGWHAFRFHDGPDDPELFDRSDDGELYPWDCRLSDYLLHRVIDNIWWSKRNPQREFLIKGVQLETNELTFSTPNQEKPDQHLELVELLHPGPTTHHWHSQLHGDDLIVESCYPNTFLVASRVPEAIEVLPNWLQEKLHHAPDSLQGYASYRQD